jgi:hypothetical protein
MLLPPVHRAKQTKARSIKPCSPGGRLGRCIPGVLACCALLCCSLVFTAQARAEASDNGLAIGASAGTLGAGVSIATALVPRTLTLEADLNAPLSHSSNYDSDGLHFHGTVHVQALGAMANLFPTPTRFHLSAGLFYNDNRIEATAQAIDGSYTINGQTYTNAQLNSLSGRVRFQRASPYLGLGWGDATRTAGLHFIANAGVLYQGDARVDVYARTSYPPGSPQYNALYENIDAQRATIKDDLSRIRWYPVAVLGLLYRF